MGNKICVIVGVGPGIGLAVARQFAHNGFSLALLARRKESLKKFAATLESNVSTYSADAANSASIVKAFDQIKEHLGAPDVLVYNAAAIKEGQPSTIDAGTLVDDFRVNVAGGLVCAQQVIPVMKGQRRGTILFTGGGLALHPHPQYASLAVGKAALRNLSYSLAAELEPFGIHVAMVTISGYVQPNTPFDPDTIAQAYWQLYEQKPTIWEKEVVFTGQ